MQIIRKRNSRRMPLAISLASLVILLIAGFVYFYVAHATLFGWSPPGSYQQKDSSGNTPPTKEQVKAGQSIKAQSLQDTGSKSNLSGSDQPLPPTPGQNGKSTIDMDITAANQTPSMMQIRTLIYGVGSDGQCTLTLTKAGSSTVTRTTGAQNLSNTSTCAGFDIALSDLSRGDWLATVSFSDDSLQGTTSKTIAVK